MRAAALLPLLSLALGTAGCDASGGAPLGPGEDDVPFVVTSHAPHGGGVPLTSVVELRFNQIIDVTSVDEGSLRLVELLSEVEVAGTVSADGFKLRFTPSGPLVPGTSYGVLLAAEVRGVEGDRVGETDIWGFKTAGSRPDDPPDAISTDAPRPR
jgi:hypothetical protein